MQRIVVVGSANTDMILSCETLPRAGETVLGGRFMTAAGGKGANQAVAAARLGAAVSFVACLGRDALGEQALANYQAEGIDCRYITRADDLPSGVALIMVDATGENMIGVASGANSALTPAAVEAAEAAIRAADVVMVQLEIPLETVAAALRLTRMHGVRAILNPAPARELPDELLHKVTLTPNEGEAALLTGMAVNSPADAEQAALRLLGRGAGQVVMTLGSRGALLADSTQRRLVPAFAVQAVDTTAAGDAFNGGLAVALARGDDAFAATRYACAVAALAATRRGAQPSLPNSAEVAALLAAQ